MYEDVHDLMDAQCRQIENILHEQVRTSGKTYEEVLDDLEEASKQARKGRDFFTDEIIKTVRQKIVNEVFELGEYVRAFPIAKNGVEKEKYRLELESIGKGENTQ